MNKYKSTYNLLKASSLPPPPISSGKVGLRLLPFAFSLLLLTSAALTSCEKELPSADDDLTRSLGDSARNDSATLTIVITGPEWDDSTVYYF